jgi:hypothetical protein
LVKAPILKFPEWLRKFHVHVDASVLSQPYDDTMYHPNAYAIPKLNKAKRKYPTIEHEALSMIFPLQKFSHYLLEKYFTFFTDHKALK